MHMSGYRYVHVRLCIHQATVCICQAMCMSVMCIACYAHVSHAMHMSGYAHVSHVRLCACTCTYQTMHMPDYTHARLTVFLFLLYLSVLLWLSLYPSLPLFVLPVYVHVPLSLPLCIVGTGKITWVDRR